MCKLPSSSVLLIALLFGLTVTLSPTSALAQDCGCDHSVDSSTGIIDGTEMGVAPGDVVCIEAGEREFLRVFNMTGTADAPVVIRNCGGQVVIDNADRGYGLTLSESAYVRITGTGDPDHFYGFKVRASRDGPDYSASCLVLSGKSTDYEVDHIEAYECGFAGVSAKTDPTCEEQDLSGFVQRNSRLHHLYLHDTGGEGIYFGNTGYPSREGNCDGQAVDLIPHTHEGVWIHDNIIEDTGWDGAQIGVSPSDCYFYRNRIARVGLKMEEFQSQGLQIGGGSSCEITDNFISEGPALGIIVLDAADTLIANNVVVGFVDGIYINDRDSPVTAGATYRVVHNTVVDIGDRGITVYGSRSVGNLFVNNLIAGGGTTPLGIGGDVDARDVGNVIVDSIADALFSAPEDEDYSLAEGSPAIDAGSVEPEAGVDVDQLGASRDESPDAGAFEFGALPPEEPLSPPGPGENPSSPEAGDPSASKDSGGCSCRAAPTDSNPKGVALVFLGILAGWWRWRRRPGFSSNGSLTRF